MLFIALLAIVYVSCSNNHDHKSDTHEHEESASGVTKHDHEHGEAHAGVDEHQHESENVSHAECEHNHDSGEIHAAEGEDQLEHDHAASGECDHIHETTPSGKNSHYHDDISAEEIEHVHTVKETESGECDHDHNVSANQEHDHEHDATTTLDDGQPHVHSEAEGKTIDDGHQHEEVKIQLTAYSDNFEAFAEADPFVVGKVSNVLAHFSSLPDFKALEKGRISIRLIVNGKETSQTLEKPTRKGIYSFDIKPEFVGNGVLIFDISTGNDKYQVTVPEVQVYSNEHQAIHEAEEAVLPTINTAVFTKEQSWKIDFESEMPQTEAFGQTIKTTARVQPAQSDVILLSAKTNGIVVFLTDNLLEGRDVSAGEVLFSVSGSGFADDNSAVRYMEAQNNYEKAKLDYERTKELAKDKIVSERQLLDAKNEYDNARLVYNNLNENFNSSGQRVTSLIDGFISHIFVQNGQYVEPGQTLASIAQNKKLLLSADVQQKYVPILGSIQSANIRTPYDGKVYTLEQLNGKVLSHGKSTNDNNYLIPVNLLINNNGSFTSGGFVELYLKTLTNTNALTIPNSALLEEQGNYFVFVQITPELFEKREISTGATDGIKMEILNGIAQTERVVSKGAILIKLAQATGTLDAHSGHVH